MVFVYCGMIIVHWKIACDTWGWKRIWLWGLSEVLTNSWLCCPNLPEIQALARISDFHQKHPCFCFSNWLFKNKWSTEFRQNLITQKPNINFNFSSKACLKCAAWVVASSLMAALATLASVLMLHLQRLCSFLWGCEVLVNPTRYPWTHLSSMSESLKPAAVSLQSLLADQHQMLVPLPPLLYSRFSHKQYITVILSSSRPPAARPARLPVYLLTFVLLRQEHFKKEVFSLGAARPSQCLVSVTKCLGSSVTRCCWPASI